MREHGIACLPIRTRKTFVARNGLAGARSIAAKVGAARIGCARRFAFGADTIGTAMVNNGVAKRAHGAIGILPALLARRNTADVGAIGAITIKVAGTIVVRAASIAFGAAENATSFARREHDDEKQPEDGCCKACLENGFAFVHDVPALHDHILPLHDTPFDGARA